MPYQDAYSVVQSPVQRVDGTPTLDYLEEHRNVLENALFDENNNYTTGTVYNKNAYGTDWKYMSPIWTNTVDYSTLLNNNYLLNHPPYLNTTSLVHESTSVSQIPVIKRGLKMFGAGSVLGVSGNEDTDRTYGSPTQDAQNPPMTGFYSTALGNGNIVSSTAWGDDDAWVKYERYQSVTLAQTGQSTNNVTFGVWVRCPHDDLFRERNVGGFYLWMYENGAASVTPPVSVKVYPTIIHNYPDPPANPSYPTIRYGDIDGGDPTYGSQGHYLFSGGDHSNGYRWNDNVDIPSVQLERAKDYPTWTKLERTISLPGLQYTTQTVCLSLFFGENHSYFDDGTSTPSGSIDFYNPFIYVN